MLIKAALIKPGDIIISTLNAAPIVVNSVSFLSVFERNTVRCITSIGNLTFAVEQIVVRLDKHQIYFTGQYHD